MSAVTTVSIRPGEKCGLDVFELAQGFIQNYRSGSSKIQAPYVGGRHGYAVESVSVGFPHLLGKPFTLATEDKEIVLTVLARRV